ncbi:TlpA family protein disulfide reductase [Paludisphaera soli]|uniref:TlpA family protein disulfide reductase n=1 Tax=Paludisphaera soli TaxID=2712865 RepID=UPI0013EDEECB|nr:TlpA disulfide reductase family protein [Paludisphaera soli]
MISRPASLLPAIALVALAAPAVAVAFAQEAPRSAEAVLKDLDAARQEPYDQSRREDKPYTDAYIEEMGKVRERRSALTRELLQVDPKNPRLTRLLFERWQAMYDKPEELDREIEEAVALSGDEKMRVEGAYVKVIHVISRPGEEADRLKAIDAFAAIAPKGDPRAGGFLCSIAERTKDEALRLALEERVLKEFPKCAERVMGSRRLREAVGKPFELEFADAVSGRSIRMADLKGKVVVVDFWATWCGPCVAEMPKMKELYARFKDQGVEFLGISLDYPEEEGKGLTKLKAYVAENEIPWPQYYQGNGWESEFSKSWGITGIPALFLVGPDGVLVSTEARGKLETLIPELLAKAPADERKGD